MREVIEMQVASGITKCKAATPREAEIAAQGGALDILLAHQPVGPKIEQLAEIIHNHPLAKFSVIVDDPDALDTITEKITHLDVWIDVDCGMHRSGIAFGEGFDALREKIESSESITFRGLHVYDGHLHDPSLETRRAQAGEIINAVREYLAGHEDVPSVVGGGSPTFGIWATETEWECSPGTTLLWDCGYGDNFPDLKYEVAAGLVTRVISKPGENQICLDLGHKSVAAEMPLEKRAFLPAIPDAILVGQSEEHLVVKVPDSGKFLVGQSFTAIPRHVCPTVALHARAHIYENGQPTGETWIVAARDR